MTSTRVLNGKVISTDSPNHTVGESFNEKPAPNGPSNPDPVANGITPLTGAQKAISATLKDGSPQPVDTSQPNPKTVQTGTGLPGAPTPAAPQVPFNQALNTLNTQSGGQASNAAVGNLAQSYQAGLAATTATGTPAPATKGAASGTINSTVTPPSETPAPVANFVDPSTNKPLAQQVDDLMNIISPQSTRDNLAAETKNIANEKNVLSQDKLKLMNIQNIMAGTEQDIRDEITKGTGTATDSQVLALTISRNQTLLKQATQLQDQVIAQQDLISNDTSLLASDKADAANQLSTRMGLLQYVQTNQTNQLNAYKSGITAQISLPGGLAALAADPAGAQRAEQALGWTPGTIASAANQAEKDRATKTASDNLDMQYKKAEINNINSEIKDRNTPANQKPLTQAQTVALGYATRTVEANKVIEELGNKFSGTPEINLPFGLGNLSALKSSDRQRYNQAKQDFVNAVLRPESGAAISPSEFENADKQYFPQLWDSLETISQKRQNRLSKISSLLGQSGQENTDPTKLTVSPTGELIMITD